MPDATFRPKAGDVCWQKALRDRYLDEGAPAVDLTLAASRVVPVSYRFAAQIILRYEWLGTMSHTGRHFGIMFGPYCAGVVCFAMNGAGCAGPQVHAPFGVERDELATLARGACVHWAPPGANSRLVSHACRLLAESDPKTRVVVAYSDVDAGEIGTIYQACNWTYIGPGATTRQWVAPAGRVYDMVLPRDLARRRNGTRAEFAARLRTAGWREQDTTPKHRYVWLSKHAGDTLRERVRAMALPYPKRTRAKQRIAARGGPSTPPREDGENPICPLHLSDDHART